MTMKNVGNQNFFPLAYFQQHLGKITSLYTALLAGGTSVLSWKRGNLEKSSAHKIISACIYFSMHAMKTDNIHLNKLL